MSFMGITGCGMTPITMELQILVSSIDQQGRLKNMWGVKVTQGKGRIFSSGPDAGRGETPLLFRMLRKHLAVNGQLVGSKIWLWYIKRTWPPK